VCQSRAEAAKKKRRGENLSNERANPYIIISIIIREGGAMSDMKKILETFNKRGIEASWFETPQEAVDYLCGKDQNKSVALGGSITLKEIGCARRLKSSSVPCIGIGNFPTPAPPTICPARAPEVCMRPAPTRFGHGPDHQHRRHGQPGVCQPPSALRRSISWWGKTSWPTIWRRPSGGRRTSPPP
jgi:hypothetical protein